MKILSLDVGDVRVGVAQLDTAAGVPSAVGTFLRAQGEAEQRIIALCSERSIEHILIGLPLSDDNSENPQCERVRNFSRRLGKRINVQIEFIDEYLSSEEALQRLRDRGNRRPEPGEIDALAALILLERYQRGERWKESSGQS